jgi:putative membrane protein
MDSFALLAVALVLALASGGAGAHAPAIGQATSGVWQWSLEPWVLGLLLLSASLYLAGVLRLWRHAGTGRGIGRWQVTAFAAGWLALVAALVSPLDALGARLFSAHMVQHEILMIVAAPLLVLGRPLAAWTWAFSLRQRRRLGQATHWRWLMAAWVALTDPLTAWALHALALWLWHVPQLFEAALHSNAVHVAQHTSFLLTALLFWWAVLGRDARSRSHGMSMAYLFTTMLHTGALGALLTLAPTPWYPAYAVSSGALGLDPVEDQQLGGLVMWVPGGMAYFLAGLAAAARLLSSPRRQVVQT